MARGWILDGGRRADLIVGVLASEPDRYWTANEIVDRIGADRRTADKILLILYWAGEGREARGCGDFRGLCREVARRTGVGERGVEEIVELVCRRRLALDREEWKQGYLWRLRPSPPSSD